MGMFSWAFKSNKELGASEITNLFPLSLECKDYIKLDILSTYLKILTDVAARTHGLSEEQENVLWDSCVQSEANRGLITLLAEAMTEQKDLFLVYKASVLRVADQTEEKQIRADYAGKKGESKTGVWVSFKDYRRTEMLKIYSSFEHCILSSLNKSLNLSKAIQIKVDQLRSTVSLSDSDIAREQAQSIAKALGRGNDIYCDSKDVIETAKVDTAPTEKGVSFLNAKRAFFLDLPLSYLGGELTSGIGATGEADMRAKESGLKQYFVSILRPVLKAVFKIEVDYMSEDFRIIDSALNALEVFDRTSNENLSQQTKREYTALLFNVDPDEEQKRLDEEEADRELAEAEAKAALEAAANANPNANPNLNANPNQVQPAPKEVTK